MWWGFAGTGVAATGATAGPTGFFLGRPLRLVPVPPSASMARLSLSRSSVSNATMCSVRITGI